VAEAEAAVAEAEAVAVAVAEAEVAVVEVAELAAAPLLGQRADRARCGRRRYPSRP
jgi:hypothetical protein